MKTKLTALLLCLALCSVAVLFASCRKTDGESSTNESGGMSSEMSKLESDVSDAMSDVTSGLSSIFTPDESSDAAPTGAALNISGVDFSGLDALENEKKGWGQERK